MIQDRVRATRARFEKWTADPRLRKVMAMHVGERVVAAWSVSEIPEFGWFAARQPAVVRFLEDRLAGNANAVDRDAFTVALDAARSIGGMFEQQHGVPPARVQQARLERAEEAVIGEIRAPGSGMAARQPALATWLAGLLAEPPVPLTAAETRSVGTALAAIIYALDEVTTGRPIP